MLDVGNDIGKVIDRSDVAAIHACTASIRDIKGRRLCLTMYKLCL
jgi:hypothetical protein